MALLRDAEQGPPGAFRGGSGAVQGWLSGGGSWAVQGLCSCIGAVKGDLVTVQGDGLGRLRAVQGQFMPERTPHRSYSISGTPKKLIQGCKRVNCPSRTQRNHHGDTTGPCIGEHNPPSPPPLPPQSSVGHQEGLLCTSNKTRNLLLKGLCHEMVKPRPRPEIFFYQGLALFKHLKYLLNHLVDTFLSKNMGAEYFPVSHFGMPGNITFRFVFTK